MPPRPASSATASTCGNSAWSRGSSARSASSPARCSRSRSRGPTTGALLITGATLALGGPAFIWAIPIIFALQLLLALTWAELSSHYPLTGGIYQWARQLGGDFLGWMTGLFYVVAIILVMPAVGTVDERGLVGPVHQPHGDPQPPR